jgi:hypothetical protein
MKHIEFCKNYILYKNYDKLLKRIITKYNNEDIIINTKLINLFPDRNKNDIFLKNIKLNEDEKKNKKYYYHYLFEIVTAFLNMIFKNKTYILRYTSTSTSTSTYHQYINIKKIDELPSYLLVSLLLLKIIQDGWFLDIFKFKSEPEPQQLQPTRRAPPPLPPSHRTPPPQHRAPPQQ